LVFQILSPVNYEVTDWGFNGPTYLKQRYLEKGSGQETPSYNSLIIAIKMQLEAAASDPGKFHKGGIEHIFDQTALRRFEFLDAISYALDNGHLDEKLVNIHPFSNELRSFEENRNTVLHFNPDDNYSRNLSFERAA